MSDDVHLWTIIGVKDTQIPELQRLEYLLNELQQQTSDENKLLNNIDALIKLLDTLCEKYFNLLKPIDMEKKEMFIQYISNKIEPIQKELERHEQTWKELCEQKQLLTNLCLFNFKQKPLMFARQASGYLSMPEALETELINLINKMRQRYPNLLDDILDNEYREIQNNRRHKIVITVLGCIKASKSSLINFLLQNDICPTGNKETTAKLTKITYGEQTRLTSVNSSGNPSESFVFNTIEEYMKKAKELIILKNEERKSNLCQDEVIIELPINELKYIELWDIPGFDENPVINSRIGAILKDTDLILAVLPQQDFLRQTAIDFIKPCLIQNNTTNGENQNKPATKICFIISQIDKFKPDETSKESKEEFLQHIYDKIRTELPTNFLDTNYKSSNQFIPMCSSHLHSIKDYLECRREFIEKSCQWFNDALRSMTYYRSNLLLKSIKEFSNYDNIFHQQARYERTKQIFNKRFSSFSKELTESVKQILNEVYVIMKQSIDEIVAQCLVLFEKSETIEIIEEYIQKELIEKMNEVLTNKNPQIIQTISKRFVRFSNAIELKPPEIQILKQALDNTLTENSHKNIIEQYQHTYPYHLSTYFKRICQALLDTLKATVYIASGDFQKIREASKKFITHKGYFEQQIQKSITNLVHDVLDSIFDNLYHKTENILMEFLNNQLKHVHDQLEEKTRKYIHASTNHIKIDHLRQFLKENSNQIKRMHLDILTMQFNLEYPSNVNVNENERLDQNSNFRVFTGTLGKNNLSIAAKLIPLTDFKLQEVLYIREIQHENVISYCGVKKHLEDQYYIVMPRFDCDLIKYLKEYTGRLNSDAIDQMIIQIIKGLDYIHTQLELIHRDIKLQNILVNKAKTLFVIADLGGVHPQPITRIYSDGYAAPELFSTGNPGMITEKCDIYSLGIVIKQIIQSVNIEGHKNELVNGWLIISKRCCSEEPAVRPSCKKILEKRFQHNEQ